MKSTEEKIEIERAKLAKKAVAALTKSLPTPDFNPNWNFGQLRSAIAIAAFESAIQNDVVFIGKDENKLFAKTDKRTIEIKTDDLELQSGKLIIWSKIAHALKDDKGDLPSKYSLHTKLIFLAYQYKREQAKRESAKEKLTALTNAVAVKDIGLKPTDKRDVVFEKMATAIVGASDELQLIFTRDMQSLYLVCSDERFGAKELTPKYLDPYFQSMIDNSSAAGRLKASSDAESLINLFISKQIRI